MSHYSVAVFTKPNGKTVDQLLAPFDENLEVEPYIESTKEDIIKKLRERATEIQNDIVKYNNGEKIEPYWLNKSGELESFYKGFFDNDKIRTDEELYQMYAEDSESLFDEAGNELSIYNPNSKWDWNVVGGRWSGLLKLKANKEFADSAKVKDVDFSPNKENIEKDKRRWEIFIDKKPLKEGEERPNPFYSEDYYKQRYKDANDFATRRSRFRTFAFVTPDGEWNEPGKMGWQKIDTSTPDSQEKYNEMFEKYLNEADPEWTITIVDCHI